jgi:nitric oxide reductase activation protein
MVSAAVTLTSVRALLQLFYRALSGRDAAVMPYADERDAAQFPDTRGTLRLPPRATLDWYRAAVAHRALHHDAGSFSLVHPLASGVDGFIRLFADRALAQHCFVSLEDTRIEAVLLRQYPGLAHALAEARADALAQRPATGALAPRSALLEVLARASLGASGTVTVPAPLAEAARGLVALARSVDASDRTSGDAAEAATRAYALVARTPQLIVSSERVAIPLGQPGPIPTVSVELPEAERPLIEGAAILEVTCAPIAYRGDLSALIADRATPGPMDQEAILRLRGTDGEPAGEGAAAVPARGADAAEDATPTGPVPHEHHEYGEDERATHEHGALAPDGPRSYVYPEWDHRAERYRERWCRVREVRAETSVSARVYRETLRDHGRLVSEIRRQFERVAPETLRRVRGQRDGDELDLDAAIEALADLRAGVLPSENVYMSRELAQRDLAAVFLVDLSASTAERIDERPNEHRRILDVERESIVLLIEALERVGDVYGIYGFSGTGREDVRYVVIKDLRERVTDDVVSRLDGLRPIHTTRMAPAIRHAAATLRREECATKLLVVVSDGRPFDIDYGQEYGEGSEIDYANADTRRALDEARAAGVRPFLLTIDREGGDYLREICRGIDYEVLARTSDLPARLLGLYRRLRSPGDALAAAV